MESNRQRHDASENLLTLPQMIKNKSGLTTGNPTVANTKTAANLSTSTTTSTSTNSTTTLTIASTSTNSTTLLTIASTSTNSTTTSTPQQIHAKPATSTVKTRSSKKLKMDLDIDFIEIIRKEITFNNIQTLKCNISFNENLIMYVNIRGLNAIFSKLQVYIESLKIKPILIVCAETRVLGDNYNKDNNLNGYNIYYIKSKINQNDGVVMFIRDDVVESTNVIVVNNLSILHSTIK